MALNLDDERERLLPRSDEEPAELGLSVWPPLLGGSAWPDVRYSG
jgi:hypothetical protein